MLKPSLPTLRPFVFFICLFPSSSFSAFHFFTLLVVFAVSLFYFTFFLSSVPPTIGPPSVGGLTASPYLDCDITYPNVVGQNVPPGAHAPMSRRLGFFHNADIFGSRRSELLKRQLGMAFLSAGTSSDHFSDNFSFSVIWCEIAQGSFISR